MKISSSQTSYNQPILLQTKSHVSYSSPCCDYLVAAVKKVAFVALTFVSTFLPAKENKIDSLKTVDFGYNKFVTSPYSGTFAVIPFDSDQGAAIFKQAAYKKAFSKLAPHYCPQQNINSCGIATAVIILNTVYANGGKTPPLFEIGSWHDSEESTLYGQFVWTEHNFYNEKVAHLVDKEVVEGRKKVDGKYHAGIELDRLSACLRAQGLTAKAHHVNTVEPSDINGFRSLVKTIMADPSKYMIINYNLDLYTAQGGGHISPIAAYDSDSDNLLILDTWSASNTWVWVKLVDLYKSMNTLDEDVYRGYILVDQNSG
jgi:hypothetical protein